MTHPFIEPASRLWQHWRTKHAIAHLDRHLIEDAGIEFQKNIWDDLVMVRPGYWTGRGGR